MTDTTAPSPMPDVDDADFARLAEAVEEFAYSVPLEKFVYRRGNRWQPDSPVSDKGIRQFLLARQYPLDLVDMVLKKGLYHRTLSTDVVPGQPPIARDEYDQPLLNLYTPPAHEPSPISGPIPRVEALLRWLCDAPIGGNDEQEDGLAWLFGWLAQKVQNPALLPGTAPIFGTAPGAGKGTLFRVIEVMLGAHNCAIVERSHLESRFTPWARALFVLGDEVVSNDNLKDVSERLKVLVTSHTMMVEQKNVNALPLPNRKAWMFASNDRLSPLKIDADDRRYTYFRNHAPLTDEYRALLKSCYTDDGSQFNDGFVEEVRYFWRALLDFEVDVRFVSQPYHNQAREELIAVNEPSHALFLKALEEDGIDAMLEAMLDTPRGLKFRGEAARREWDFGSQGVGKTAVYEAYRAFCEQEGKHALSATRFGPALRQVDGFAEVRNQSTTGKKVRCWVLPRKTSFITDDLDALAS